MAAARIAACTASARTALALADDPAPPDTLDVVRRQRQLLRRAAALCLDPIAEESDGGVESASDVSSLGRSRGQTATTSALPARP